MIVKKKNQKDIKTNWETFTIKIPSYRIIFFLGLFMVLGPSHLEESRFLKKSLAIRDSQETKVSACCNRFEPRTIAEMKK
jgi:hypothetical protein